jgi:putative membrane protein insertion efficiency factor
MMQLPKFVGLQLLRAYKWAISPLLPPACRFVPTCSEYAEEAVERFGVLRGSFMAAARLLRCHPFARGGYDPVKKPCGIELYGERPTTNDDFRNLRTL